MSEFLFTSVLGDTSSTAAVISSGGFALCALASVLLGLCIAGVYMFRHSYSKNFVVTLALLPVIVQMVILLVNGNLGAGIAVMGVFNLVRFRSIPGSAKDIGSVFMAMAVGLATGMGYIGLGIIFTVIVAIFNAVYMISPLGKQRQPSKTLKIMVPEDLDFEDIFDETLDRYTTEHDLVSVQTVDMGSLFQLDYDIRMRHDASMKKMMDDLRCINGNLKIVCARAASAKDSL